MDTDIEKPFIWRKKYEELGIKIDDKQILAEARQRAEANKVELEKIRERRRQREQEYRQKLSDNEFLQRQKELEQHEHWEQQEDDFLLRQHRHRSKIRIRDGRAKPIDLFSHYSDTFGHKQEDKGFLQEEQIDLSDSPVELLNPCDWFNGLKLSDLEALEPDLRVYMTADCEENQQYWKDLLDITHDETKKLQALKEQEQAKASDNINTSVLAEVVSLFENKTIPELDDLEREMEDMLHSSDPSIDKSFYRSSICRLRAYRAKIRLTAEHKRNLKHLKKKPQPSNDIKVEPQSEDNPEEGNVESSDVESEDENQPTDKSDELRLRCIQMYKEGNYSPKMCSENELDKDIVCMNFDDEFATLCNQRNQVVNPPVTMTSDERKFMEAASRGMNNQEESTFTCEAPVRNANNREPVYAWADKYQPRKPRYFNRVHTGFEWNKYNQTHYDIDNPPPKIVQGYKFNIFYPDLIDKSQAPKFTLTPCKDDSNFCIIRFSAGPPYEDIAFRIVDKKWNNSSKSGYRCQFMNNMLQLWFQFKRDRYRR